jgi:hypothetical protein
LSAHILFYYGGTERSNSGYYILDHEIAVCFETGCQTAKQKLLCLVNMTDNPKREFIIIIIVVVVVVVIIIIIIIIIIIKANLNILLK